MRRLYERTVLVAHAAAIVFSLVADAMRKG